jgi:outer membrane murein-binding lipoprotein Lpp
MITKTLDRNAFSTTEWMAVEHHSKRQEAIASEVANVAAQVESLHAKVDALHTVIRNYHASRLFRALRALRLL